MKTWFSVQALDDTAVEISIHDEIGLWGMSAADFIDQVKAARPLPINLTVHSPGGNFFDGLAMYNYLRNHNTSTITGHVLGAAGSAATLPLMAADTIMMPEDSYLYIHNPWRGVGGDADVLQEVANQLRVFQTTILNIYATRTGMASADVMELTRGEGTWLPAAQAVELGFADEITEPLGVAALAPDVAARFGNLPGPLQPVEQFDFEAITDLRSFEHALRDSGVSKKRATALASCAKRLGLRDSSQDDAHAVLQALSRLEFSATK